MLERAEYRRNLCERGHYLPESTQRQGTPWVEHQRVVCMDCEAIDEAKKELHKGHMHDGQGPCPICLHEVAWVDRWSADS